MAAAQTLETRLVLTWIYGFDVIDATAVDAGSVSVNDFGDVAYMDSGRVRVGDGLTATVAVDEPAVDPNLVPNPGAQINNVGQVAETLSGVGPGNPRAELWDGVIMPGSGERIALGAPTVFYFKNIAAASSLTNDGQMAFAGYNGTQWEIHLADARVDSFSPNTLVTTMSVGTAFNVMAGAGDRVVVGSETGGIETINLFDATGSNTSTAIASSASPLWNEVGINPGISDNGEVVVFYGDLTQSGATLYGVLAGRGIYASIPTGPSLQDRTIIRVDGDLGRTGGGTQINFAGFNADGRINVLHQEYGRAGMDDDALVVSYIATPSAASPAGAANDPLVFTANTGIFSSHVDIFSLAGHDIRTRQPLRVVQVGDTLAADTVTSVSLYDALATPVEMPDGVASLPQRGDHYLAFQADTIMGMSMAVRGNYINPHLDGAATPPRKTQLTGPTLLADDLTPTVTWANLPNVTVDFWEVLGYHILSGKQVVNLAVTGNQTAITLPTTAALGTHEFWIRGHNAAGAEPWTIGHRLYFHVVAPAVNPTTVEITGPVSSVLDDTPHVSWDAFPNGATYDGLVYSLTRGVEVARFEGVTGSSFELPRLPTHDTYSVHMRAHTAFGGTTGYSGAHVFRIDASSTPLPAPKNIAPTGNGVGTTPVFTWDAIPGTWQYEIKLEGWPFGPTVATDVVDTPMYTTPVVLAPQTAYQFSVRAWNDALEATDWVSGVIRTASIDTGLQDAPKVPDASQNGDQLPALPTIESADAVPVVYYSENQHDTNRDAAPVRPEPSVDVAEQPLVDTVEVELTKPAAPFAATAPVDDVFAGWSHADDAVGIVIDEQQDRSEPAAAAAGLVAAIYVTTRRERETATPPARTTPRRGSKHPRQ